MKAKCIADFNFKGDLIKEGDVVEMSNKLYKEAENGGCVIKLGSVKTTDITKTPKNRQMKPRRRRR